MKFMDQEESTWSKRFICVKLIYHLDFAEWPTSQAGIRMAPEFGRS